MYTCTCTCSVYIVDHPLLSPTQCHSLQICMYMYVHVHGHCVCESVTYIYTHVHPYVPATWILLTGVYLHVHVYVCILHHDKYNTYMCMYMYVHVYLHIDTPLPSLQLCPTRTESLLTAMRNVGNPRRTCEALYLQIQSLTEEIREKMASQPQCELNTVQYTCIYLHVYM